MKLRQLTWRLSCSSPSCSLAVLWPPCFPFGGLRSHRGALGTASWAAGCLESLLGPALCLSPRWGTPAGLDLYSL